MYDVINASIFPTTATDAAALVTGCTYNVLVSNGYSGIFTVASGGIITSAEYASDIAECQWRDREHVLYARWQTGNSYIGDGWGYTRYISSIALNIDRISQISMDENLKNKYIAELRCGRAFLSFLLYDYYGPIPLPDLETLKNPLLETILPRATEEEMQAFIETDLIEAAKVLPYSYKKGDSDYGRFTKGLCQMLLMKLYMYTKQWDKAEAAGREIMKPEYGYSLVPRYIDIFSLANEKNAETIYSSISKQGYAQHKWHPHCLPSDFPTDPPSVVKWGGNKLSWDFIHTFEAGDQRLETISTGYDGITGITHTEELDRANSSNQLYYGAIPLKYEIDKATTGEDNQIDLIIYRYADAITLLSEAIVRKGNVVTQEAVDLLNRVRTRAGLQAYTLSSFADTRDFLDKLLLERAHELYYEGSRRQDLIRDGSWVETMKNKARNMGQTTLVDENRQRFPLPQSVINEGKGIIKQNPGY
ncbi:membrane protein [Bacteroidia bacterium]|nr:membrane protein [Bacteroidia bacterium]